MTYLITVLKNNSENLFPNFCIKKKKFVWKSNMFLIFEICFKNNFYI